MKEEIKSALYKGYRIAVFKNETSNDGKYRVYGHNFLGQTNPPEDVLKLPSYNLFGNDPDILIEQVKFKLDQHFKN